MYTAAEHGITEAQVHYAQMLLDGTGVQKNPAEAFQWFKLAANNGHILATNLVGRCYENGWGVKSNMLLATYWFKLAAKGGLDRGMYNYATSRAIQLWAAAGPAGPSCRGGPLDGASLPDRHSRFSTKNAPFFGR